MLNLVNYELKRTFRSKSTYFIILGFLLMTLLPIFAQNAFINSIEDAETLGYMYEDKMNNKKREALPPAESENEYSEEEADNEDYPMDSQMPEVKYSKEDIARMKKEIVKNTFNLQSLVNGISARGLLTFFMTIFVAISSTKEYSSGYIKNLITVKNYRFNRIFGKLLIYAIYFIILFLVNILAFVITASILSGDLNLDWGNVAKFGLVLLVAELAIASIVTLIANISTNITATTIISILLIQGILSPIYMLIDNLKILPFEITKYSLIVKLLDFSIGGDASIFNKTLGEVLTFSVVYLIIFTILNVVLVKKKDINIG